MEPVTSVTSPIADLSYRGYDGVLEPPSHRWRVIARMTMRNAFKRKWLWVLVAFSSLFYLIMICVLFFIEQMAASQAPNASGAPNPISQIITSIIWKDQFIHGIGMGQMWFLMIVLAIGAGSIANDNRANALLVYLSKPCDKRDYLFGKWAGLTATLFIYMFLPTVMFYFYGVMSYRDYGFLSDALLILKLPLFFALSSAFYASLILGISSMFKQGRIAGATMAGVYFLTNFFTVILGGVWASMMFQKRSGANLEGTLKIVEKLYYGSVDGLNIGLAKAILGTNGSVFAGMRSPIGTVPAPPLILVLSVVVLISALSLRIAWSRIRAVEVV